MSDTSAGFDFGIFASLKGAVDKLSDTFSKWIAQEKAYQLGAEDIPIQGSTIIATGQVVTNYIDLGGPAYGNLWVLRRLIVMGNTWATTAAGSANVHVTGTFPPVSGGITMVDNTSALPAKAFYSSRIVAVRHPSHLVVEIVSGTNAQQYVATGQVENLPDKGSKLLEAVEF